MQLRNKSNGIAGPGGCTAGLVGKRLLQQRIRATTLGGHRSHHFGPDHIGQPLKSLFDLRLSSGGSVTALSVGHEVQLGVGVEDLVGVQIL